MTAALAAYVEVVVNSVVLRAWRRQEEMRLCKGRLMVVLASCSALWGNVESWPELLRLRRAVATPNAAKKINRARVRSVRDVEGKHMGEVLGS